MLDALGELLGCPCMSYGMLFRGRGRGVCCREELGDVQTGARVSPSASA